MSRLSGLSRLCIPTSEVDYSPRKWTPSLWQKVLELVEKHRPRKGQRNRKLFRLAQAVKGLMGDCTTTHLKAVFDEWWKTAPSVVKDDDETFNFNEFVRAYESCKLPGGMDWERILKEAEQEKLPEVAMCYTPPMQVLLRVCARLQRLRGEKPFFMSVRDAASLMRVSLRTAAGCFNTLTRGEDALLELVGEKGSLVTGKATEYRYLPLAGRSKESSDVG